MKRIPVYLTAGQWSVVADCLAFSVSEIQAIRFSNAAKLSGKIAAMQINAIRDSITATLAAQAKGGANG